jgi:hypothetical protein
MTKCNRCDEPGSETSQDGRHLRRFISERGVAFWICDECFSMAQTNAARDLVGTDPKLRVTKFLYPEVKK